MIEAKSNSILIVIISDKKLARLGYLTRRPSRAFLLSVSFRRRIRDGVKFTLKV